MDRIRTKKPDEEQEIHLSGDEKCIKGWEKFKIVYKYILFNTFKAFKCIQEKDGFYFTNCYLHRDVAHFPKNFYFDKIRLNMYESHFTFCLNHDDIYIGAQFLI